MFSYCDFVVFTNIALHVCRISRNDIFLKFATDKCKSFWMTNVLPELRGRTLEKEDIQIASQQKIDLVCSCQKPLSEKMISCNHENCKIKVYHYICVGLESKAPGLWICEKCTCDYY